MFWIIPLVAVVSFALTMVFELRAYRRKNAAAAALLAVDVSASPDPEAVGAIDGLDVSASPDPEAVGAIDGLAVVPWSGAGLQAPITGRNALAYHVEVITRERRMVGNGEEITTRRIFEEAYGSFLVARGGALVGAADLANATSILPVSDDYAPGATVFSSSTSKFAGSSPVPPANIAHFLGSRGLPFPTQDSLFRPGFKITVNERIVVPDQPFWAAGHATKKPGPDGRPIAHLAADEDEPLFFGVGTTAQALQAMQPKMFDVIFAAFAVAFILGAVSGMIIAMVS
jgi:hypothetical protein